VKLWYGERCKEFGGICADHNKSFINNLFGNFKKNHIIFFVHVRNWCRKKGVGFSTHLQSIVPKRKTILLTNDDHKKAVIEGIGIIEFVNAPFVANEQPFVLDGDPKSLELKSFWYKVIYIF
jgi:hypothetical protein